MQRRKRAGIWLVLVLAPALCAPRASGAEVDAAQIKAAIDRGVAYLRREQADDGSWPDYAGYPGGTSCLCTLALLNCGLDSSDPTVAKALKYIRKNESDKTYVVSLQTMVFCMAEPDKDKLLIRRNALWLEKAQITGGDPVMVGAWRYGGPNSPGRGDNSNSQFALLALYEAERAGIPINANTWRLTGNYWANQQNVDGSWNYTPGPRFGAGTGSMTCAGIASLVIASGRLGGGDAKVRGDKILCCQADKNDVDKQIEAGVDWLGRNFSVHTNPGGGGNQWLLYYLYAMERAGRLTNHRFIGKHDWYREGAEMLVGAQDQLSGFWQGAGPSEDNQRLSTAFSLLFLAKGRRPVLISKLIHEPVNDANHHRNDLSHLTSYTEKKWRRDLTWQIIDERTATTDDLIQSPVLWMSGSLAPQLTDKEVLHLREYINQGGFLFAEGCCESAEFDAGFRELMERVFPEPEYRLHLLTPDHPAWTAEERLDPDLLAKWPLYGIDVGCRTSVIYSPSNLSCYWELANPDRGAQHGPKIQAQIDGALGVGINVLAYATNRELKFKLDLAFAPQGEGKDDKFERAKLFVGKLRHGGGWNAAPGALPNLLHMVAHESGIRVNTDQRELVLTDEAIFAYPVLFMHGRNAFHFAPAERKQLKTYVERGGLVLADAVCASEQFTKSFRDEMALIFSRPMEPIPVVHPLFTPEFGGFDLKVVHRREPGKTTEGGLKAPPVEVQPELEGVKIDNRYGVVFSPYDLSCALEKHEAIECAGYTREDAARIGLNAILYALHQ